MFASRFLIGVLLQAALLWGMYPLPAAELPVPTGSQMRVLRLDKVLVTEAPAEAQEPMRHLHAQVLIRRPMAEVWHVLLKQESLFASDPHMKKVEKLSQLSSNQELVEYTLSISKFLPTFRYVTRNTYQYPKTQFKRVRGSFKDFSGHCLLQPLDNGKHTLMTYSLWVDPGLWIPDFVARQFLKATLPGMLQQIRQQVYSRYPETAEPPRG